MFVLGVTIFVPGVRGDEGMWLFTDPPRKLLKAKYGFEPTAEWLVHLQRACMRFNNGGSGSFVSPDGLVMTNHHVAAGAIQKLSTAKNDMLVSGYYAKTRDKELKCHDLELNVLMSIEDVTERVNGAVKPGSTPEEASKARRAVMNTIEKESFDKTGLRSDVVTLYNGGLYHLYRYKKYTDVRLVFAPEQAIAYFGGDADNFEYPRYDLDVTFFRVYEDGKPAKTKDYLKWSPAGPAEGELVFVAGNPGHTCRLNTPDHLKFLRDLVFPYQLDEIRRREVMLNIFSERLEENARRARGDLLRYCNGRKARLGILAGLQDPAVMERKIREWAEFGTAVHQYLMAQEAAQRTPKRPSDAPKSPRLDPECLNAGAEVIQALEEWKKIYRRHHLLEEGGAFNSMLYAKAITLVRLAVEKEKPNAQRLREYRDSNLASLKQELFSEAPIYKDLETAKLTDSLGMFLEQVGADSKLAKGVLRGKSPAARAAELVGGTRLDDVAFRRELAAGGKEAIAASDDPMIVFARWLDPDARAVRKEYETKVEEPMNQAYAKLARARFAVLGKEAYPDATFTLRLAYGTVKGYRWPMPGGSFDQLGKEIPPWTTMGGAFDYAAAHGDKPPFRLPKIWVDRKDHLDLKTPMNFVSTIDIIGGNSGSPLVNREGQIVGLVFDGNAQSLVWDFIFDDVAGRAVSVHSDALLEALRNVYQAEELVEEIEKARK
ncbi:MAG: S46 family peptidase [Pirellulales bacterium]|nr:S46 family peptidase [Pirellulales bacterium]